MIPHLCPELPAAQKEALKYGVKVPLVYTSVALRNWTAFKKLGINGAQLAGDVSHRRAAGDADRDRRLQPDADVAGRSDPGPHDADAVQARPAGARAASRRHVDLLTTPFSTFERNIRDQLARILGGGGFDPARDIDAITVNRWPHGYAYEYNPLWDPDWPEGAVAVRDRPEAVRPDHDRQLGRRRGRLHRRRDRSGLSRRERVDCGQGDVGVSVAQTFRAAACR